MFEPRNATVVIIEDDDTLRHALTALVASAHYRVECHASAEAFLQRPPPAVPCCLLTDLNLPGISGLELQARLAERRPPIPMLLFSGNASDAHVTRALDAGALHFLRKPFDPARLLACTERGLRASAGDTSRARS